jgi:hypothetical protein
MENVDGPDADKSELIKLEFIMDPDNPTLDNNYSRNFVIFKDLSPEEWLKIKFLMSWRKLKNEKDGYPWRNLLARPGWFRICWRAKPCDILNIVWGGG